MNHIETARLFLRPLSLDDTTPLTLILSDPAVMQFSIHGVYDRDATSKFIGWCLECYSTRKVGPSALVEKTSGELVGFCGLFPELVNGVEENSLGYRLGKKFWNRGLATEAVEATLDDAFEVSSVKSVVAIIESDHAASLRVSEKAGFDEFTNTRFHDRLVRVYRMSYADWVNKLERHS